MNFTINPIEQEILLANARESIASKLESRQPQYRENDSPVLQEPCGAFVTLHKTDSTGERNLRGCIGRMTASLPLIETVRTMAR